MTRLESLPVLRTRTFSHRCGDQRQFLHKVPSIRRHLLGLYLVVSCRRTVCSSQKIISRGDPSQGDCE